MLTNSDLCTKSHWGGAQKVDSGVAPGVDSELSEKEDMQTFTFVF